MTLTVVAGGPTGAGMIASRDNAIACASNNTQQCTASYAVGASVTLDASVNPGYALAATWPTGCSGTSCTVTLTQDTVIDATFDLASYALTVSGSSHGSVMSSDGNIDCGSTCMYDYTFGSTITLTAMPDNSYNFDHWTSGPCVNSTQPTCVITMAAGPMNVAASYRSSGGGGDS